MRDYMVLVTALVISWLSPSDFLIKVAISLIILDIMLVLE